MVQFDLGNNAVTSHINPLYSTFNLINLIAKLQNSHSIEKRESIRRDHGKKGHGHGLVTIWSPFTKLKFYGLRN